MKTNREAFLERLTVQELAQMMIGDYPAFHNCCRMCIHNRKDGMHCSGKECQTGVEEWLKSPVITEIIRRM